MSLFKRKKRSRYTDDEVRQFLTSDDRHVQAFGLRVAAQASQPEQFLELIDPLFLEPTIQRSLETYLGVIPREKLIELLGSPREEVRERVLAAAAAHRIALGTERLTAALRDESNAVRLLASASAWSLGLDDLAKVTFESLPMTAVPTTSVIAFLEVAPDTAVLPIKKLAWYPSPKVRLKALERLASLKVGDADLLELGITAALHEEPNVRADAVQLIAASHADNAIDHTACLMADPSPVVREAAARGIAEMGAFDLAAQLLRSESHEVTDAAIQALAHLGRRGEKELKAFFEPIVGQPDIPEDDEVLRAIRINFQERTERWLQTAFHAIGREPKGWRSNKKLERCEDKWHQTKESVMNRLLFLKNVPFFEELLLEELQVIDDALVQEEYQQGETIFEEGSFGDRFYMIYEGDVQILHGPPDDRHLLAELGPGEHFAEMALFEEAPRSATAVAGTHTVLLALDKERFHSLMIQRPAILMQICRELSRRLRDVSRQVSGRTTDLEV